MSDAANKIAEVTPEHIAGFGEKYAPEDFTPSALERILSGEPSTDAPEPNTPQAVENVTEAAPAVEPKVVSPPQAEPQTQAAPDGLSELRTKYQDIANQLNTERQKREHYESLLSDPAKTKEYLVRKRGVSAEDLEKLFTRESDGSIDFSDPKNQAAFSQVNSTLAKELEAQRKRTEELEARWNERERNESIRQELSGFDRELAAFGAESALGEPFSVADMKWAQVHRELGAENAQRFATDEAFRKQYPHLELPKNFEAYAKVNKAISHKKTLPDLDLGIILQSLGVKPASTRTTQTAQVPQQQSALAADVAQLPPTGSGGNLPDPTKAAEAFFAKIAGKDFLTPEEYKQMDHFLKVMG